jgi:hypothetical protein
MRRRTGRNLAKAVKQIRRGHRVLKRSDEPQRLVPEPRVCTHGYAPPELRVVAKFSMRIKRQVIGEKVDVMPHQALHSLFEPACETAILPAPKKTVVHQQRISLRGYRGLDQCEACGHPRYQPADPSATLDLQTVRPIIFKEVGPQQS